MEFFAFLVFLGGAIGAAERNAQFRVVCFWPFYLGKWLGHIAAKVGK